MDIKINNILTKSSDLKLSDVRCKLRNINDKNEETFITVYNVKGERRHELLKELEEIASEKNDIDMEDFNSFYIALINEFTDLILNTYDLKFLLNETNMTGKKLIQEMNDMIYELQFDSAMNHLASVREMTLSLISASALEEVEYCNRVLENGNKNKGISIPRRKPIKRRFIK